MYVHMGRKHNKKRSAVRNAAAKKRGPHSLFFMSTPPAVSRQNNSHLTLTSSYGITATAASSMYTM